MIGTIFQYLDAFGSEALGEDAWESLLHRTDLSQPDAAYSRLGIYPDSDLMALVGAAVEESGLETSEVVEAFGLFLAKRFSEDYARFFEAADGLFAFLESVDRHIHVQVRKLHPEAVTPSVQLTRKDADEAVLVYRSSRKLCALARGMMVGAAEYYETELTIQELQCMHDGADACEFELRLG